MSNPVFRAILMTGSALALFACSSDDSDEEAAAENRGDDISGVITVDKGLLEAEKQAAIDAAEDGRIDCALGNATEYKRNCTVERVSDDDGQILVVRHPDGGFRRFRVLTDGRGLEPAEGFDETSLKILDDQMIEVTSGGDSYRLPAQIKSAPKPAADGEAG